MWVFLGGRSWAQFSSYSLLLWNFSNAALISATTFNEMASGLYSHSLVQLPIGHSCSDARVSLVLSVSQIASGLSAVPRDVAHVCILHLWGWHSFLTAVEAES